MKEDVMTYSPLVTYKVTVNTGDRPGAGTSSKVFITLVGKDGDSGEHQLESGPKNFSRKGEDVFGIDCLPLGELTKVRVKISESIFGSSWFLDKVSVFSEKDKKSSFFLLGGYYFFFNFSFLTVS